MGVENKSTESLVDYIKTDSKDDDENEVTAASILKFGFCKVIRITPSEMASEYSTIEFEFRSGVTGTSFEADSKSISVGDELFFSGYTLLPRTCDINHDAFIKNWVELYGWGNSQLNFYEKIHDPICSKAFYTTVKYALIAGSNAYRNPQGEEPFYGLFLHGSSFLGKTTAANLVRLIYCSFHAFIYQAGGNTPVWLEADTFGDTAKQKAKFTQLTAWLEELTEPDLLIIDDLDKFSVSESVEVALFGLLKRRIEARKFTVITANQSAPKIVQRFDSDRREPILNRLKKFFIPIHFKHENE